MLELTLNQPRDPPAGITIVKFSNVLQCSPSRSAVGERGKRGANGRSTFADRSRSLKGGSRPSLARASPYGRATRTRGFSRAPTPLPPIVSHLAEFPEAPGPVKHPPLDSRASAPPPVSLVPSGRPRLFQPVFSEAPRRSFAVPC